MGTSLTAEEKRARHRLRQEALAIAGGWKYLAGAMSAHNTALEVRAMSVAFRNRLRAYIQRAPRKHEDRERYAVLEALIGCIEGLRRGSESLKCRSYTFGMSLATDVLTLRYVADRSGIQPYRRSEGERFGRRKSWPEDKILDADGRVDDELLLSPVAVMVEACRHLRRGYINSVDVHNPVATVYFHQPGG